MPASTTNPIGYFQSDFLPEQLQTDSFSETILRLAPNGTAQLFALIGATGRATAKAVQHGYTQKRMNFPVVVNSGAKIAGDTTLTLDTVAGLVPGTVLMNQTTREHILVVTVPDPAGTDITVERGAGRIVAGNIADTEVLISVGTSYAQSSTRPIARSIKATYTPNYTQIVRTAWAMSDTDRATYMEDGWENVQESQLDCMLFHAQDIEQILHFGQPKAPYGAPYRSATQGVIDAIDQYASGNAFTAGATTSYDELVGYFETAFMWDSDLMSVGQRVAFLDDTAMKVVTAIGVNFGTIHIVQEETSFGMRFQKMTFYKGSVMLLNHPLFNGFNTLPGLCEVVDLPSMRVAYMDGRDVKEESYDGSGDSTDSGVDAVGGSLTSEFSSEFRNPEGCCYVQGLTAAAAA